MLSRSDIASLQDDANNHLRLNVQQRLYAVQAYYHHISYLCWKTKGAGPASILSLRRDQFDEWMISAWEPHAPIVPWRKQADNYATGTSNTQLTNWRKSIRPDIKDYKLFKHASAWVTFAEDFQHTVAAHELSHIIDPTYVPGNPELHLSQKKWMYKVLETVILNPVGSSLVTVPLQKHSTTYDCASAWTDIQEHYNKSMVAVIQSSSLSTFLTSYKFHLVPWKGTQTSQIIHWEEQQRRVPTSRTREIHRRAAMQLPQRGRLRRPKPQERLDQRHHFKEGNRKHYLMHLL